MRDGLGSTKVICFGLFISLCGGLFACAGKPTIGQQMIKHGHRGSELGKTWNEGHSLAREGQGLVEKGEKKVAEGRKKMQSGEEDMRKGEEMVRKGRTMMVESEEAYRKHFPDSYRNLSD